MKTPKNNLISIGILAISRTVYIFKDNDEQPKSVWMLIN